MAKIVVKQVLNFNVTMLQSQFRFLWVEKYKVTTRLFIGRMLARVIRCDSLDFSGRDCSTYCGRIQNDT